MIPLITHLISFPLETILPLLWSTQWKYISVLQKRKKDSIEKTSGHNKSLHIQITVASKQTYPHFFLYKIYGSFFCGTSRWWPKMEAAYKGTGLRGIFMS